MESVKKLEPLVEIVNLSKHFKELRALDNVSLKIMPQEVVFIIGSSGSGKSTLLRCINRLIQPTSGSVIIEGQDITRIKKIDDIRKEIGIVFQQFNLFLHLTVENNIKLPLIKVMKLSDKEANLRVKEALETVNLSEKLKSYPGELSGGQQQRVAIARVLAMRPKLILFDEPTSALDPELTGEVLKVMKRLVKEFHYTIVVVSHEMGFAREAANRIIYMDEGKIKFDGTPEDVFVNPQNERLKKFLSSIIDQ
ncbi:MAG: Glutamine transport ATP-binding protein GlnQ [Candidatus Heimdallarchaeota archaeon LC_3]|nr:MAG: Glutamine transport ATP-binding protein GlnQ [Candidatus Heimdallarchaeota archaeon LC_3]